MSSSERGALAPPLDEESGLGDLEMAYRAQGFTMLRSVFDEPSMEGLGRALDRQRAAEEARFGLEALKEIGQDGYVSDLFAIGQPLEALLDSEPLHFVLRRLLGESSRLHVGQGILLDPGKGRGIWPRCWHADMFQVSRAIGAPRFCSAVNCLVLVDDVRDDNGPTCVLPGSQALLRLASESAEDMAAQEIRAAGPKGSLLLIDGGTWHSASMNRSSSTRRVMKLLFTRSWIRPQVDYASLLSPEGAARLTPRVRRLIGLADA